MASRESSQLWQDLKTVCFDVVHKTTIKTTSWQIFVFGNMKNFIPNLQSIFKFLRLNRSGGIISILRRFTFIRYTSNQTENLSRNNFWLRYYLYLIVKNHKNGCSFFNIDQPLIPQEPHRSKTFIICYFINQLFTLKRVQKSVRNL